MTETKINIQLNKYIKRFYLFKILKGIIYFSVLSALTYFILILLNYLFYLPTSYKTFLFWLFISFLLFVAIDLIFFPLLKLLKIIPSITYSEASINISKFYNDIQDKLQNILELLNSDTKSELVLASIEQKYNEIKIFDFSSAVNFKDLTKYLKILILPVLIYIFTFIFNSSLFKVGYQRFSNYSTYYEKPLPFKYFLLNKSLLTKQGDDFRVTVDLRGNKIPDEVFINFGSNSLSMSKKDRSKHVFYYTFKSLNKNIKFSFVAGNIKSKIYTIKVVPSPKILDFSVKIIPPKYTKKSSSSLKNTGNLIVPFGSKLIYHFYTVDADSIFFLTDSTTKVATKEKNSFTFNYFATNSLIYSVLALNKYSKKRFFTFNIKVIPDLFPSINIKYLQDSAVLSKYYYYGKIQDDYGFSNLFFNYKIVNKDEPDSKSNKFKKIPIPFNHSLISQQFYFSYDFKDLNISADQTVYYFFSVYDNDILHHYKETKTGQYSFFLPSSEQLDSLLKDLSSKDEDKFNEINSLSFELQNEINNFKQKELDENLSQWEKQEFINNLLLKQNRIKNLLDSLKNINAKKLNNLNNFDNQNKKLLEKQKQIQKLLDKLLTPEMKKLLKELKKLQSDFDAKELNKVLKNSLINYKKFSEDLNRSHELLKRMTLEQNLNSQINQFKKLSKDYKNIYRSLKSSRHISAQMKDSIATEKFKIRNTISDYDSLMKFNKTLEKPYNLDSLTQLRKELNSNLNNLDKTIKTGKRRQSRQNAEKISKNLKQLSDKLNQALASNISESNGEDIQTIRFLLSNILTFSFEQEHIYYLSKQNFSIFSNNYKKIKLKQLNLKSEFKIINDSLYALARRNPSISKLITDELFTINQDLKLVNIKFQESNRRAVFVLQRKIISSANKIALMLNESLENMKKQSSSGNGNSSKNKRNSNSLSNIKNFQKQLQESLKQMINQMKSGKKPSSQQMGIQFAKREALQKMIQDFLDNNDLSENMKSLLKQSQKLNNEIKQDILNKNMNIQTLNRDEQIRSRLLESENADRKRKYSNKRVATTSANIAHTVPDYIKKSFKLNSNFNEIFQLNTLFLNNFYKKYYNEYVIRLRNQ